MAKNSNTDKSFIFLIFLTLTFFFLVLFVSLNVRIDEFTEAMKSQRTIVTAFVVSREYEPILTEVFFYDNVTGRGALYNIPENMGTLIKSINKMGRLDLLFQEDHPKAYFDKIGEMLGIEIDFFIHFDIEDLARAVDLLEGLNLFIPNEVMMTEGDEFFVLPSGSVRLDGDKMKTYLDYRTPTDTENDIIVRKHDLTKALFRKFGLMNEALVAPPLDRMVYGLVETDLDRQAFQSYMEIFDELDTERLVLQKVLGKNRTVDGETLLFPYYDDKLMREMTRQIVDTLANMDVYSDEDILISVEIRNGTDISGLASRTAQLYKSYGYKISAYKNADRNDYENTTVIDRRGNPGAAERVASLIRCESIHQLQEDSADDTVDVIIILGKDFDGRYVKK